MERADKGMAFLLQYENTAWYENGTVSILDRRIYPIKTEYVVCHSYREVAQAIADMVTQSGGPYTAAAMGMALAAHEAGDRKEADLRAYMEEAAYTLSHARPTTVEKMKQVVEGAMNVVEDQIKKGECGKQLVEALALYGFNRLENNYRRYEKIGSYLADKIPMNGTIMTQCFAETVIGALLKECRRRNNPIKVICPETRPYFQGSRLTASVVCDMGFDVTVITDNMPASVMEQKQVDVFTSAADVITMDGHVVNKTGTFQIALAARYWGIPYFTTGIPNKAHPDMAGVSIETRDPALVTESMGIKVTMEGVKGYYPAFDVTPPKLCDGIVTDKGILSPYNLGAYFAETQDGL